MVDRTMAAAPGDRAMSAPHDRQPRGALATSVTLLAFIAGYAATGYWTLDPASRAVPLLAAGVTAVLIAIELGKRVATRARQSAPHDESPVDRRHELRVLASVVAAITGIYLVGFLIALPVYLAVAIAWLGRQPWRVAIATAALTTAGIYLAFEIVLSYRLFAGVLFS